MRSVTGNRNLFITAVMWHEQHDGTRPAVALHHGVGVWTPPTITGPSTSGTSDRAGSARFQTVCVGYADGLDRIRPVLFPTTAGRYGTVGGSVYGGGG